MFLTVYPILLIINRIFLFLDYILVPEFEKAKVKEPIFIMGVNRSGTTFFHKLLASSNQFSTSKTWDLIIPSLSLRKFLSILSYALTYFKIDQIEKKKYPNILVTSGFFDSQVQYWEPLKYVAKLRDFWEGNNKLYLYLEDTASLAEISFN